MTRDQFNEYVLQQSRILYRFAFRILNNQEEAEDAVQEIFIKLWNMGEKLDGYTSIDALATTMTKNHCIDQLRKHKHVLHETNNTKDFEALTSPSPLEQLENRESDDIIQKIIDELPDNFRTIIRLREIDGFTYEEIAEKTQQNINTLRVTISRARKLIRDEFNKYQYERRGIKEVTR